MSNFISNSGIASYISQDILIVPFHADFYEETILGLRKDILSQISAYPNMKGLIIDLSNMNLIDLNNMEMLRQTLDMAKMLGVTGYIVGIKASVTIALVELGYDPISINAALNVGHAMDLINHSKAIDESYAVCGHEEETIPSVEIMEEPLDEI